MLSDPLSVTYDGAAKSLTRKSVTRNGTRYETDDGQFVVKITKNLAGASPDSEWVEITLTRISPDPTPSDVFDPYRRIRNSVKLGFEVDSTRHEATATLGLLKTALLAFVTDSVRDRVIAGEG